MADLTITAANVVAASGASIERGVAGETITAGQAIYLKPSDGKLWKAQCDGTADEGLPVGIALNGGSVNQSITYQVDGQLNIGATTAKTTAYVLSATLGGICPQADLVSTNKIVYLGYATATDGSFVMMKRVTGAVV
jgi:hypothetical protein